MVQLSVYRRFVSLLVIGLIAINFGALVLARQIRQRINPFINYADVFPGQSRNADDIEAQGFSCLSINDAYHNTIEERCTLHPVGGSFSSVSVTYSKDTVRQIMFIVRDNALTVGDLVTFLEVPAVYNTRNMLFFSLPDKFIVARTSSAHGRSSLFLTVWSVSFAEGD